MLHISSDISHETVSLFALLEASHFFKPPKMSSRIVLPQLGAGGGDVRQANLWECQGQVREAHEDRP